MFDIRIGTIIPWKPATAMIRQLNMWLNHMQKLPSEQCLTGQDAADYIARCIHLL